MLGFDFHGLIWFHGGSGFRLSGRATWLFDTVDRRKGNADGGVLARPLAQAVGERDSDGTAFTNTQITPGVRPERDRVMELVKYD